MKLFIVLSVCLALAIAQNAEVVKQELNIEADGSYSHLYELSDQSAHQEAGKGGVIAEGSFRWVSPEGEQISVTYKADENGYQPQGAHLPQPHPIPEAILKAIEYIKANAKLRK
jgi:hypothetical protein